MNQTLPLWDDDEPEPNELRLQRLGLRVCHHCHQEYPRITGGGTKFCANCIGNNVYGRHIKKITPKLTDCDRCGSTYRFNANARWRLCGDCTAHPVFKQLASALGKHRAPTSLVLQVMDHPHCANTGCAQPLLIKVAAIKAQGWGTRVRGNFTVDHDHSCCPDDYSCGNCIRGILCRRCNTMLTTDQPQVLRGLADYLDRYTP